MRHLNAIINGFWAISRENANAYVGIVKALLTNAATNTPKGEAITTQFWDSVKGEYVKDTRNNTSSDTSRYIAVHRIEGVMTQQDQYCGPAGTETLGRWIQDADRNPSVSAHIIVVNSPGGEVSGLSVFVNIIENCKKPTIGYTSGIACSAAQWTLASCTEAYAASSTDIFGSIGTMITLLDMRDALEKEGVKLIDIYADGSEEKNSVYQKAIDGDTQPMKDKYLNPMRNAFVKGVQKLRPQTSEHDIFKGDTYLTADAKKFGLIDGIKTFEQCVQRASQLAETSGKGSSTAQGAKQESNNLIKPTSEAMKKFNFLGNVVTITSEQEAAMTAEEKEILAKLAVENQAVKGENAQLSEKLDQILAGQKDLSVKFEGAEKRIAALEGKPAAPAAAVTTPPPVTQKEPTIFDTLNAKLKASAESGKGIKIID